MFARRHKTKVLESRIGLTNFLRSHPHIESMIVHRKRRILYMKSTKTAGTSILRKTLEPNLGGFIHKKDTPFRFDRWLSKITDEDLSEYFIFATVRNPYDRFLSMAGHFRLSVDDFIIQYDELVKKEPYKSHLAPQVNYTHLRGGLFVDRILKFENIHEDFAKLMRDLNLPNWELPHANKSDRSKLPVQLTGSHADFVSHVYRRDIEAFGYTKL